MLHRLSILIFQAVAFLPFIYVIGCATDGSGMASIVPQITQLIDLGKANVDGEIQFSIDNSDKHFMPGEWVAIKGQNLTDVEIRIDELPVPVAASYQEGLIIRVPQKLSMRNEHTLTATTPSGQASIAFKTNHFIVGTDTDGNTHHFMRTNMDEEGLIEAERYKVDQIRPFFNLIADQGALLYGIGVFDEKKLPGEEVEYKIEIKLISLVAPEKPKEISSKYIVMRSVPTAASLSHNGLMLILGYRDIALVDVSDPYQPKQVNRYTLPAQSDVKSSYIDAEFVNNGENIAVLDTYSNRITLLNVSNPSDLQLSDHIDLLPDAALPATADIFTDPLDTRKLWVIGGRNLRNFYTKFGDYYKNVFHGEKASESNYDKHSMLIPLNVDDNSIIAGEAFKLPGGFVPFFGVYGSDRNIYISKINARFLKSDTGHSWSDYRHLLKNIKSALFDNLHIGGVLKINIDNQSVESEIEGYGVYYHIAQAPDLGTVFTLARVKAALFAPFVKPAWGIGIQRRGTYAIRDANLKTLYPPYSLGYISIQE